MTKKFNSHANSFASAVCRLYAPKAVDHFNAMVRIARSVKSPTLKAKLERRVNKAETRLVAQFPYLD